MLSEIQVPKSHYYNFNYNHKARWITYHDQMRLLNKYGSKNVLEIGPGTGWMKRTIKDLGITVKTVDIDPKLHPDYVASIDSLPIKDGSFDTVCAFEVLEHLPFETFVKNISEMARVSKKYIIFSVPNRGHILLHVKFKIPFVKYKEFFVKIPTGEEHVFDGQHYWEIGKKGYTPKIVKDAIKEAGLTVLESFVPTDTPSHHYFVVSK
ncbi:MAG: SAM-dependent methyltransferase [Acidimicrobiales bacterium]|jgi:SAM-dependent methyltransferase